MFTKGTLFPGFVIVVEGITVPPEPPPLLCSLALHDQIEGCDDRINVFDLLDISHIAFEEPAKMFHLKEGGEPTNVTHRFNGSVESSLKKVIATSYLSASRGGRRSPSS